MNKEDLIIQLPDGRFEQKVQVDRRRLESMILGQNDGQQTAESFFTNVTTFTQAEIHWPSQLKIGARTKKDPYVKVIGTIEQIDNARNVITSSLQVKKERVALKMEIHHNLHSHIIGKGGKGIQKVMKLTNCHIHFPDSNKYSESNKSDQVSVSGTPLNVFTAQKQLRSMCPLIVYVELPWLHNGTPDLRLLTSQIDLTVLNVEQNVYSVMLKANGGQDSNMLFAIRLTLHHFGLTEEYLTINTSIMAKEDVIYHLEHNDEHCDRISELCAKVGVTLQTSGENQTITIYGPPTGVLNVRNKLLGLTAIVVSFDCHTMDLHYPIAQLEAEKGFQISSKKKANDLYTISIKSIESKLAEVLQCREHLLALPPTNYTTDQYSQASSSSHLQPLKTESAAIRMFLSPPSDSPKSPDPEDSPLAASILKGAKDISRNSDLFKKRGDRGEMLIKATQAIFDDSAILKNPRYPTDLWSGYGFSSSLPADLLKGMMDLSTSSQEDTAHLTTSSSRGGLCSVREEDEELSDFSASSNAYGGSRIFDNRSRNVFSASTSVFDSSTLPYDLQWDINYFTDPSMVLAQLGCSEYMTQLRDQEIDMHAFLLLDEQNLKDIGISTIGARKKIHHAILKLRESARHNGYGV